MASSITAREIALHNEPAAVKPAVKPAVQPALPSVSPSAFPSYADATRRVKRKIGFFTHLGVYLLINSGLITLNLLQGHHRFWAAAPLLGWGIGLLFHGLKVFVRVNPQWKQRMIEQELRRK